MPLTVPTVHLNGTSRKELLKQIEDAHAAVRNAIDKLCAAGPNGRDYYPQGPQAINHAVDEHSVRVQKLVSVQRELEELAEVIAG
jgi:hypothetical protein